MQQGKLRKTGMPFGTHFFKKKKLMAEPAELTTQNYCQLLRPCQKYSLQKVNIRNFLTL
jgi:hypothetical protein